MSYKRKPCTWPKHKNKREVLVYKGIYDAAGIFSKTQTSSVRCTVCKYTWRTKAKYVDKLAEAVADYITRGQYNE